MTPDPEAAAPTELHSVVLAGGGSAGHISPLLALADCLGRRHPDIRITVLGTEQGMEQRLVPARGYDLRSIPKVAFPRRPGRTMVRLPLALRGATDATASVLREVGAQAVVGFGGYVSTPAYLAGRRLGLPVVIHEQNARAGLANRLGARMTPYVATTFASTRLAHARVTGMPLRREITTLDRAALRDRALEHFGLARDRPTLLVTGGSLGAQRLNQAFEAGVALLRDSGVQVLHLTGHGKEFRPAGSSAGTPYVVLPYADRIDLAYAAADLVVARAGANTVCELTAVGLPGIYVPLPIGNGEQRLNAADVVRAGGGILVDDGAVTPQWILQVVVPLMGDRARLEQMAAAAAALGQPDADDQLAELVVRAVHDSTGADGDSRA